MVRARVTFGRLVAPEHQPGRTRRKLARARGSSSAASLFMALDRDPRELGLTSGNLWWSSTADLDAMDAAPDLDGAPPPCSSRRRRSRPRRSTGAHTLEAFALVPWDLFAPWAGTASGARPADDEVGRHAADEHARRRRDPGLALRDGEDARSARPVRVGPGRADREPGLCYASTLSHGVSGATLSGIAVAREALGCRTRDLLREGEPPLRVHSAEDPSAWPESLRRDAARARAVAEPAPITGGSPPGSARAAGRRASADRSLRRRA